jgi:peptidyl-tRNA hydrolase
VTDEESPWALQMAARVEKAEPPLLEDVFAAAALAVIALLDDHRALPGGEWHEPVHTWNGARIRKIMRRARASAWERSHTVPGLTIRRGTAEVRVFVPGRLADAPPELAKLQIQSTPLPEPEPVDAPPTVDAPTLVVALNPAVEMSWGKRGAQVGHAAQRAWERFDRTDRLDWNATGRRVRVVQPVPDVWDQMLPSAAATIRDGGFTEIAPGTLTAAGSLLRPG